MILSAKGREETRSHAADVLPQRATNMHEALRLSFYHQGARGLAAEFLPQMVTNVHEVSAAWLRGP